MAERMNSVEINGSFSLQRRSVSRQGGLGRDFVFAVKGGRFITHMKKLSAIETPLASSPLVCSPSIRSWVDLVAAHRISAWLADRMDAFFAQLPRTMRDSSQDRRQPRSTRTG